MLQKYGRIDVLVNNAGIAPRVRADLLDMGEDSMRELLDVNLVGPFFLTQRVARQMIAQGGGMIVNICATTSYPQASWYYQMEIHGNKGTYIHCEGGAEKKPESLYFQINNWTKTAPDPRECAWLTSMDNFASALRCGTPLLTTPQEGRNSVRMINALYHSASHPHRDRVVL